MKFDYLLSLAFCIGFKSICTLFKEQVKSSDLSIEIVISFKQSFI